MKKIYSLDEKIFSILIVLLPFLYQYRGIAYISLGELLLLPFMVYYLADIKKVKFLKSEIIFYFYIISLTFVFIGFNYFKISNALTVIIRMCYYIILINESSMHFSWRKSKEIYNVAVIFFSVYVFIQFFYHKITNGYLPMYLDYNLIFPPERRALDLIEYYKWSFRPSSLFMEPSYYSLFCMPFLCFKIFKRNKKVKECIVLLIVIGAIFLSGAGSGISAIIILCSYAFLLKMKNLKIPTVISGLLIFTLMTIFISYFLSLDLNGSELQRLQTGGSLNQRVIRGIIIFKELSPLHKMIGVGINNIEFYMKENGIITSFDEKNLNYMCSILQVLNCFGLVGLTLLFNYLFSIWKKVKKRVILKALFLIIIFTMSYEGILFSYRFAFLFIILNANIKKNDRKIKRGKDENKNII